MERERVKVYDCPWWWSAPPYTANGITKKEIKM